jgi:nicotinamidase-related amidase
MSLFNDRANSALLVIDVQNGVVEDAFARDSVIAAINTVIDKARERGVSVIWIQHSDDELAIDSDAWQIVPELQPRPDEKIVRKLYRSSFEATELEELLASLSVGHLYITGAQTNNCVRHTSHSALERGYDITLISDAHTASGYEWNGHSVNAEDVINEQNDGFTNYSLPGRKAVAKPSADIDF